MISSFKTNKQSLAIVVDRKGRAIGVVTFDAVIDALFDIKDEWVSVIDYGKQQDRFIHRHFEMDTSLGFVEQELGVSFKSVDKEQSLESVMESELKRPLEKGDHIKLGHFKFSVTEEATRMERVILIEST